MNLPYAGSWIIAIWNSSYLSWELQRGAKVVYVQEIKLAKLLQWLNGSGGLFDEKQ